MPHVGVWASPTPQHVANPLCLHRHFQQTPRGPAGNLARRVPVGQSLRFWPSLGHPVPRNCLVRGTLTGAIPRLWSVRHFPATPASVPSRKFDEEVLRFWRGRRPHPLPPLRCEVAIDTAECGGEGEELKEAGGRRPPASFKTSPLPRLDSLLGTVARAGGGPPLTCTALRAARRKCRCGLLREGKGWG